MWYPGGSETSETKEISKYKTFKELKQELGDKFERYMYESNIELLTIIDKAIEYMYENWDGSSYLDATLKNKVAELNISELERILKGA